MTRFWRILPRRRRHQPQKKLFSQLARLFKFDVINHMERNVVWQSNEEDVKALEIARIEGLGASGKIIRTELDMKPYGVEYQISWNEKFEPQHARIGTKQEGEIQRLDLRFEKGWHDTNGLIKGLKGCVDLDLWPTPLTNTITIRRLDLQIGEARDIKVLWIKAPTLEFKMVNQRYTRLKSRLYRFEDLDSNFEAELKLDSDDLVQEYPGLFTQTR